MDQFWWLDLSIMAATIAIRKNYRCNTIDALDNPYNRFYTIGFSLIRMRQNYQNVLMANWKSLIHFLKFYWYWLPFYPGKGDALDEVPLCDKEDDDHGQQCHDRGCH